MKKAFIAIALTALALAACESHRGSAPAMKQDAIKALGSTVPSSSYDRAYWLKQHDTNTPEWRRAKRLCEQTVLANYPNCMPVNDIVQIDRRKSAEAGNKAAAKIEAMSRRGYLYDYTRKLWLPAIKMQAAGCVPVPAYLNNPKRTGFSTWRCPAGTVIPKGLPDPQFSEEEERATN